MEDKYDPLGILRSWLPHFMWMGVLAIVVFLMLVVFKPLTEAIFLGAAIASLTYPILYQPILRFVRQYLHFLEDHSAKFFSGIAATIFLIIIGSAPFVILIINTVGPIKDIGDLIRGLVTQDKDQIGLLFKHVDKLIEEVLTLYPTIPIDKEQIILYASDFLKDVLGFATSYMTFLFKGTGGFAVQLGLAIILLCFMYAQGDVMVRSILRFSPLPPDEGQRLLSTHRAIILRLLLDIGGTALAQGIGLGFLVWTFTGFNFFIVAFIGTLISLIPFVGMTMVWLPFASVMWSKGDFTEATFLAILSIALNFLIGFGKKRLGNRLHEQSPWTGFMIFMSIVGGILSFGIKGFLIGPMIMVSVIVFWQTIMPLYGPMAPYYEKE